MRFRDIFDIILLFVAGLFAVIRFGRMGKIMGLALIAAALVWLVISLIHSGVIKPRSKKSKKDEEEKIRRIREKEKLEKYDIDSGLGYCACCGSYSVKDGVCELCGEKETE